MFWRDAFARPAFSEAAELPEPTREYMQRLYPKQLELVQAQVLFRHGERTPVRAQLTAGRRWMHCAQANRQYAQFMAAAGMFAPHHDGGSSSAAGYTPARWVLRVLTPSGDNEPASQPTAWDPQECAMGQLTDTGLASLHRTGRFLKRVYLDRLGLVPADGSAGVYVRSTDYTRVLQSTFALLGGMFTGSTSSGGEVDGEFLTRHAIYARSDNRETLHGNVGCYNFLRIHFGRSVAQACQDTAWLGAVYRQTAALPSIGQQAKAMMDRSAFGSNFHPVFDELVALAAHGEDLPVGLTRDHLRLLGAAAHHQWYAPGTSASGQRLGYGLLLAELVATMDQAARGDFAARMGPQTTHDVRLAPGGPQTDPPKPLIPRLALYGAHDITLAPLAHIMGHPASSDWMPFASTLALELLRDPAAAGSGAGAAADLPRPPTVSAPPPPAHFVRILFNGQPIAVPTCAAYGKHHPALGPSVCTLDAFYEHIAHIIPAPGALDAECGTPPV